MKMIHLLHVHTFFPNFLGVTSLKSCLPTPHCAINDLPTYLKLFILIVRSKGKNVVIEIIDDASNDDNMFVSRKQY